MLFMVIENFDGNIQAVAERFQKKGRMLPDGVVYHASWVERSGARCFQIMESPTRELLDAWIDRWRDLVDFEVIPVLTSADFWESRNTK
jgi:Protein of unknown function (DUF3303)